MKVEIDQSNGTIINLETGKHVVHMTHREKGRTMAGLLRRVLPDWQWIITSERVAQLTLTKQTQIKLAEALVDYLKPNNRQLVEIMIPAANPKLLEEINYHLNDVEHEDPTYDIVDAFEDAANLIESSHFNYREVVQPLYRFYVRIGYAVEVDIEKVVVSHGKRYWFKLNGKHYTPISSWESWIQK